MAIFQAGDEPPRRFRSTAAHYVKGRPPYADLLIRRVATLVGLERQHRVLDLGCGPGVLARAFAPLAGEVVAMDPEPAMLRAAAEASAGFGNIRMVACGSDDLGPALGRFRLVVMGRSFHWMDRASTLRRLDALVEPEGAVALFHTDHAAVPANAWTERFRAVRHRYGAEDHERRHSEVSAAEWLQHEAFLLASAFCHLEGHSVFEERRVAAERLVDRAFSMSSSAPERLGDRAAALERDIIALIEEIAPDGRLTEVIDSNALIGRRITAWPISEVTP